VRREGVGGLQVGLWGNLPPATAPCSVESSQEEFGDPPPKGVPRYSLEKERIIRTNTTTHDAKIQVNVNWHNMEVPDPTKVEVRPYMFKVPESDGAVRIWEPLGEAYKKQLEEGSEPYAELVGLGDTGFPLFVPGQTEEECQAEYDKATKSG